jgi:hypothetical protein
VKTKKIKLKKDKVDLSKFFEIVSWIFLRLILIYLGFILLCGVDDGLHQHCDILSLNKWIGLTFIQLQKKELSKDVPSPLFSSSQ